MDSEKKKITFKGIIHKLFGRVRWFILLLAVVFVIVFFYSMLVYSVLDDADIKGGKVTPHSIIQATVDDNGNIAFMDYTLGRDTLTLKNLETGDQKVFIDADHFLGKDSNVYWADDIVKGDGDVLYARLYEPEEDAGYIKSEKIVKLTSDMDGYEVIFTLPNDTGEKCSSNKLDGLNYENGILEFSYNYYDKTVIYEYNTETGETIKSQEYLPDDNGNYVFYTVPVRDSKNGEYLFLYSDGNVYMAGFDEPFGEPVYKFEETAEDFGGDHIIRAAEYFDGKLYVGCAKNPILYTLENGELTEALNMKKYIDGDEAKLVTIDHYNDGLLVVSAGGAVFVKDGAVENLNLDGKLMFYSKVRRFTNSLSAILFLIGAFGVIVNFIIRKKTIIFKHLISVLPIIAFLMVVVAYRSYKNDQEKSADNLVSQVTSICELAINDFEDEDFSGLTTLGEDCGAASLRLREKLKNLTSNHKNEWSNSFNFLIVTVTPDRRIVLLASDTYFVSPLTASAFELGPTQMVPEVGEITVNKSINSITKDEMSEIFALGKIKNDTMDAYLMVRVDNVGMWYDQRDKIFSIYSYVFLMFLVLAVILTLNAIAVTRGIKKAEKAVKKIAEGDLTARANFKSNDELGEICHQVDEMAGNLNEMFEEKDRTEMFYYKFVPEKFREFLDKENFTDLQLGDAKSRELTVLFCDIRSFSINSEIMTAKENFDFINKVYGKAGPIVREHNGFVDKFIGDAIMALFENADDAVRCGIEMYHRIVLDKTMAESLNVSSINIGIGIHSGMAMVGIVGECERLSGTVISDTVNLSSRLETLTKQYGTAMLISKDTVDRLSDSEEFSLRYVGILQVAGVNEVKGVYEVLDCLPDDIKEERQGHSEELREAIRLFHLGDRNAAVDILSKIECDDEKDSVIKKYRDYISSMSEEDKGNVFRFTRK